MIVLVMGAASTEIIKIRLCRAEAISKEKQIYLLGDDLWSLDALYRYPRIPGKSTMDTLVNFKQEIRCRCQRQQVVVVSAWYHLPRCWLILHTLGFKRISLVPSTRKWWGTGIKTMVREIGSWLRMIL